jgi:hypothetical protein
MPQEDQEAGSTEDRPAPAGSRSCKISSTQQLEFATLETQLQVRNGTIHHLVLFRTQAGSEPDRGAAVSTSS